MSNCDNTCILVSVLLPVYKEPLEWIQESIKSIINQSYKTIELVIILDTPDRSDVCNWLESLHDSRVCWYVNENNIGLVDTLNKGIGLCNGDYIARMDADDIAMPYRIEKQLSYLQNNACDLVGSNIETFNENGSLGRSKLPSSLVGMERYIKYGGSIPHPTWFVKKEIYMSLGGYRNISYAEDYDFIVRALLSGFKLGAVSEICLRYRQNLCGISQDNKGKQKLTAKILREQVTKKKIYDLDYIHSRIDDSKDELVLYQDYYKYTRTVRNVIKTKKVMKIFAEALRFSPRYFRIFFYDLVHSIVSRLLSCDS